MTDAQKNRIQILPRRNRITDNTVSRCIAICLNDRFQIAGVEGGQCSCGLVKNLEKVNYQTIELDEASCGTDCPGDPAYKCGSEGSAMNVWDTGYGEWY